jgi:soluble lytic murein transglycosylase
VIQALAWQESKFEATARSRSNALGLLQLKRATAAEIAHALRDPEPSERALLDPALNLQYGTQYLLRLLKRFDGTLGAALAAYNGGPSTVSPRWRRLVAQGGEALLAELASTPETRDYVKRVLGVRQAYRELRPSGSSH